MALSRPKLNKIEKLKIQARFLYKEGLSTRIVGKIIGKSHTWVADAVKEKAKK